MFILRRYTHNPILEPDQDSPAESYAVMNGCPVKVGSKVHLLYRALSHPQSFGNDRFTLSTIGRAISSDGLIFKNRSEFIAPEEEWERYGCEDPRVTKLGGKYYTFYTALSSFPFTAAGIRVGLAISKDMKKIKERHLITPFNAKAMALFPEKIKGKFTVILAAHTDTPPSKIAIAQFDKEEDMWSEDKWRAWHDDIDSHVLNLKRTHDDQVEVGAPPIKTKWGWLIVYSHIQRYGTSSPIFGIEAALLDLKNPRKIIGQTRAAIMVPEEPYEKFGIVPNIIFPSGALIENGKLKIYYGGADTVCAEAEVNVEGLVKAMLKDELFVRSKKNPILISTENAWEKRAVFNPAAIDLDSRIHLLYRAMSEDNTSVMGYAGTKNGITIDVRLPEPAYVPREDFERKGVPGGNSGCEDGRLTRIDGKVFMCYTAFNGLESPRVAITSIPTNDFIAHNWKNWAKPVLVSPPNTDDKDACIMPITRGSDSLFIHRINRNICASWVNIDNLKPVDKYTVLLEPRAGMWDGDKIGLSAPPILTSKGWLMTYHGVSGDHVYRIGLALLDLNEPTKVIGRTTGWVFEPVTKYENQGQVGTVVFPCGLAVRNDKLLMYYGGADSVVGVAYASLKEILKMF